MLMLDLELCHIFHALFIFVTSCYDAGLLIAPEAEV